MCSRVSGRERAALRSNKQLGSAQFLEVYCRCDLIISRGNGQFSLDHHFIATPNRCITAPTTSRLHRRWRGVAEFHTLI